MTNGNMVGGGYFQSETNMLMRVLNKNPKITTRTIAANLIEQECILDD